jgi:excisionase family DNA binding protein
MHTHTHTNSLLTLREAAEEIRSSTDFLRTQIREGALAFHRVGGRIRIARIDLDAFLARRRTPAASETKSPSKAVSVTT